ncbi:MAG: hypothetical protein ACP59X_04745 [Solidesulfovibrio sp. DCME]|uniref:hypothetical protein n=1 Tax=Solidesulfovibrio sp. DCME TaxID=3447380 RepID=UPI003D0BA0AD
MKILQGDVWKRRGVSLLWGGETLSRLAQPQNVMSIRQFFAMVGNWPSDLPCNEGNTLVIAGLEGCVDLLEPTEAESWLESDMRPAILAFQDEYNLEAALVFWLPTGKNRVRMKSATEAYTWVCSAPHSNQQLDLGRILWAGAEEDVARIVDPNCTNLDPDGPGWIGLHHPRLS